MVDYAQHRFARLLILVLDPILDFYSEYCVLETFHFASYMRKFNPLLTLSISWHLIYSVCLQMSRLIKALILCRLLYRGPIKPPSFSEVGFVEMMEMATNLSSSALTIERTDKLMEWRWVVHWDPLWRTFSLVFVRDNYLTRSLSLIVIVGDIFTMFYHAMKRKNVFIIK